MKFSFNSRKLKYGSISTAFTVLFVAVVVIINILAGFLTERFSLKLDMTEAGLYSLSDESKELLKGLEDDITIYILATQQSMEKNVTSGKALEVIQRYSSESGGRVRYEFIDPNKNPAFFEKYEKARNAQARALVVEGPERYLVLQADEFAYQLGSSQTQLSNRIYYQGEELLSSAILYVSSPEVSAGGFVTGHNETEPELLKTIFEGNNFETQDVDLLEGGVPAEINNLVISAPQTDFSAEEIAALDEYMKIEGNNLYVFWGLNTPSLPTLERYLEEWGIAFSPYVICDESSSYTSPIYVVPELTDSDIIDKETQGQMLIVSPRTRPVDVLWQERGYTRVKELVATGSSSYGKLLSVDNPIDNLARESDDASGPFTVGAIAERMLSSSIDSGISRVIVFGTYEIASEDVMAISRSFNNELMTGVVSYANPSTYTMQIEPKVEVSYDLNVTEGQVKLLFILLVFVMPALIIAAGVFVFIRRRNR